MRYILDFHIHSRYARACSPQLTLANIALAAERKGVDIIATGDFTHPMWFQAISDELEEIGDSGLYHHRKIESKTIFIIGTEVSLVYRDGDKSRRIHLLVLAPNITAAASLNKQLGAKYNLRSDGRPILGISAPAFVKLCLKIDSHFLIYPAHIWTPWYSVFGSKSGFDSIEECFQEQTENIYAYETGLSSNPAMNWRVSALDNLTRLSSSDAHSLDNIGREANIFSLAHCDYQSIYRVIKNHRRFVAGSEGVVSTIEYFPEEGMYHYDGHRDCNFSCSPVESKRLQGLCPRCGRPLLIGVSNRVNELADRPIGFKPEGAAPFVSLVGLDKIIAEVLGIKNRRALTVSRMYDKMIAEVGTELFVLMEADLELIRAVSPATAVAISNLRDGKVALTPGFDGQYGKVSVLSKKA